MKWYYKLFIGVCLLCCILYQINGICLSSVISVISNLLFSCSLLLVAFMSFPKEKEQRKFKHYLFIVLSFACLALDRFKIVC